MKANFNIDIELGDLFSDDEDSVQDVIKREITKEVVTEVKNRVKEQISDMLDVCIRESIDKHIGTLVREIMVKKFDENAEIRENTYNGKMRPVKELCSRYFAEALDKNHLESKVKDYCKTLAEELKRRYDLQFAALIVDNLRKQNLLADDRLVELIKQ